MRTRFAPLPSRVFAKSVVESIAAEEVTAMVALASVAISSAGVVDLTGG